MSKKISAINSPDHRYACLENIICHAEQSEESDLRQVGLQIDPSFIPMTYSIFKV